jgi:hypothetical protein
MAGKYKPLIDERNYTVTTINGYRRSNLLRAEAIAHAVRLREQMRVAGWRGEVHVYYRDGQAINWAAEVDKP